MRGFPGIRENDFVIIDHEWKTIICIEVKTTLNGQAGDKAVKQTQELKERFEAYFASELASGGWAFVGMIYTNKIKTSQPLCPDCSSFVIEGPSELHIKLSAVDNALHTKRKQWFPSYKEYFSLVKVFVFVVLHQRVSTHCTITSDVHDKVVGKPAKGKNKDKPTGQGDFKSIIFWTKQQAEIMLTLLQFVFFISPWSTGKTICMREKAVMWAKQNPTKKLFFVVVRDA